MKLLATIKIGMLSALTVMSMSLFGQGTLSGTITDQETGEAVRGAQVYDPVSLVGDVSDANGKYTMDLPAGDYTVTVSFVGFKTQEIPVTISDGQETIQDVQLALDIFELEGTVTTATFSARTAFESPLSITSLNVEEIEILATNSQADILRTVPGIHAEGGGGEVASNVFVRGMPSGGQYQFTPLQVDGLPVLSAFGLNSSAHDVYFRNDIGVRNLEFVRGGVSTLFGTGSVAGIINYTSHTGNVFSPNKVKYEWGQDGRARTDFMTSGAISEKAFYNFSGFYRYDEGPLETGLNTVGAQIRGNIKTLFNEGRGVLTVSGQYIDDKVQFYLPYPLQNDNGDYSRPTGNDGETVFTTLTGQATDFSFDTVNGIHHSPIGDGVATEGGYVMAALDQEFDNGWSLSAKARYANYAHQFNLFLDGDGVHNVPETQAGYLADRGLVSGTFTYASTGQQLASGDLLFENRILDRDRPLEDIVSDAYITRKINTSSATHNITIGTFNSFAKAGDNNWIYNILGDFRNAPEMVNLVATDTNGVTGEYSIGGYVDGSGRQTSNRHHSLRKSAVYVADEMVFDQFTFDIGARYENAKGFITRETGVGSNTFEKGEVETSGFAVAAAAMYRMSENLNVYVNGSRGYFFPELRSVRFSSPGVTQSYEPENILQGELGAKFANTSFAGNLAAYFVSLADRRS
ncbi:MAG: TonB-dependent receptor, partial [Calditrichota bacterium]